MLPSQIVVELNRLTQELSKGYNALYEAECDLAEAEKLLDTTEQKAFISAQGRSLESALTASQTMAKLIDTESRL